MLKLSNTITTCRSVPMFTDVQAITVIDPETLMQKVVYWLGSRLKMFKPYIPDIKVDRFSSFPVEGDINSQIEKSVLDHLQRGSYMRDMIVLVGNRHWADMISNASIRAGIDLQITHDGYSYRSMDIRIVPYIDGVLVVNKKDL